ncbi:hypothetical protein [Nocardia sp. NPDC052566]|uniref:hypothetical protein n=1 Tax=Nocardia sp. NPDC052566 TaxID=3364330 RepID=UPI0037CA0B97
MIADGSRPSTRRTFTIELTFELNVNITSDNDPQMLGESLARDALAHLRSAYRGSDPDDRKYFNAGAARVMSSKVEDETKFL